VTGYIAICAALFSANAFMVVQRDRPELALPIFAALMGALFLVYARRRRSGFTDLVRLAKYPAFVLIVAAGRPAASPVAVLVAASLSLVIACAYEVWHDRHTPLRMLHRRSL
jgi:hypothetical protein